MKRHVVKLRMLDLYKRLIALSLFQLLEVLLVFDLVLGMLHAGTERGEGEHSTI